MVGTGGFGHCFPAAALPFGAVQLGPDTGDHDWDHCSGYHYKDDAILGFSHTHLSGTGIGDMQDFRVMPGYSSDHNNAAPEAAAFARTFSHAQEHAEPGYYRVKLDSGISAEMTATDRAGMHRYTFPNAGACLLLDLQNVWRLDKKIDGELGFVEWAEITVNGSRTRGGISRWSARLSRARLRSLRMAPESLIHNSLCGQHGSMPFFTLIANQMHRSS
jgi:hypothetical protein